MILKSIRITIFFFILLILGCKDNSLNSNIPYVAVNIYISLQDPEFIDLTVPSGSVNVTGGSRGIVVYRVNQDEFKAYDRHCTYVPSSTCGIVEMENSGVTLRDNCCSSVFSIFTGFPSQGPATVRLKEYTTSFDGNFLRIYN
jgi:nitrite reductase/ring-hydroxylating ferredoxin subunit